jgi:iron complex outermembrane receptor protein
MRYAPFDDWTLIVAGFDLAKPTMGFRSDNSFGPVGHVRHRGVEASLTGKLAGGTRIVLGGVVFNARLAGELADTGKIGRTPPGLSRCVINANVEQPLSQGWSVDTQVTYQGRRYVDPLNLLRASGFTTLNLGVRKKFAIGRNEAHFRLLASNVTGTRNWVANASGLLVPVAPRTVRGILTVTFRDND